MQIGPRIRFDKHTLGNVAKNVAPALAFTPAGVLGAGLLATAGGLGRGESLGHAALSGVENAAAGAGLASAAGKFGIGQGARAGFGLGGHAAEAAPSIAGPSALPGVATQGGLGHGFVGEEALDGASGAAPSVPHSLTQRLASSGGKVLSFAEQHPNATSGALQALGGLSGAGSENRARNAQASLLEQQNTESQYDFDQRKRRAALYAPIFANGGSSDGAPTGYSAVGRNPYLPGA